MNILHDFFKIPTENHLSISLNEILYKNEKILWQGKVLECSGTNNKGRSVLFKWNNKVKSSTPKQLKLLHHNNNLIETIMN